MTNPTRRFAPSLILLVAMLGLGCGADRARTDAGSAPDTGLRDRDSGADAGPADAGGAEPDATSTDAGEALEVDIDIANSVSRRCDQLCQLQGASCVEQCFGEDSGARATYRSAQGLTTEFSGCSEMIAETKLSGGNQLSLAGLTCCCL